MSSVSKRRVVIVGAGIAGLAAARGCVAMAKERGVEVEIVVVEREAQVGGKAQTRRRDGWLLEAGPTGYLDNEPIMDELVAAAGLEKLAANEAAARRFLVRNSQLKEIQAHPVKFFTSGILSPGALLRIATEPLRKKLVDAEGHTVDESVWDFAARRLGPQAADRLIAPMVLGVFAGDAKRTSLPAAFPRMAELEAEYGSLVKALLALKKKKGAASGGPAGPSGKLTSFAGGLDTLPVALAARGQAAGDFQVLCGREVRGLSFDDPCAKDAKPWRLQLARPGADGTDESLSADAVILAAESFAAARLLENLAPTISAELAAIPTPPVAVVGLGYGPAALARAPHGFGALIQRGGKERILGVLWDTHLFAERSPNGTLLMRCMIGGATDTDSGNLGDDELVAIAKADLARLFQLEGADAEPIYQEVVRWPRAIPQYEVGHPARVRRVKACLRDLSATRPGLFLTGNYLDGVAFNKAAKSGYESGRAALTGLA